MATNANCKFVKSLKIVSYNMHGFNQGCAAMDALISTDNPDVFLCQEHWLSPANLYRFDDHFSNYFSFGCSAMNDLVGSGILRGRPFGGVLVLIKKDLRSSTKTVHCDDRYAIVKISNVLFASVYLPCVGTPGRLAICQAVFHELWSWRELYPDCDCCIAGDFNVNLDGNDEVAQFISSFCSDNCLTRCDSLFPNSSYVATYSNFALNHQSYIDYALVSCNKSTVDFRVVDPSINFSDHSPLMITLEIEFESAPIKKKSSFVQHQLRWDKADIISYYMYTGNCLPPVLHEVNDIIGQYNSDPFADYSAAIDSIYNKTVSILAAAAALYVPVHKKNFCKFWWNEELSSLKEAAVEANEMWKVAKKPRHGPIFEKRQKTRAQYRKCLRDSEKLSHSVYTNELHEALLEKDGPTFWKCWRSKFQARNKCTQVDGCVEDSRIAENFANYFSGVYSCNSRQRATSLQLEFETMRENYFGFPLPNDYALDTESVSKTISQLKCGRAADISGLTAEHLMRAHPVLPVLLSKLFHLIILCKYVPSGFVRSYLVPIPKFNGVHSKALTCEDFRGIAISPVVSKVFEYCFIEKFGDFLQTDHNQFGFKKGVGCQHAIYTVRKVVERFLQGGCTVNLCAVDLSKAFDKVNHQALLIKLMSRNLPVVLLDLLDYWLHHCFFTVKWNDIFSDLFCVDYGVRQGSVLSPFLFAIYLSDVSFQLSIIPNCYIILYADDILLIATSINELQCLFSACERELLWLDMRINAKKSCCLRIGPRCNIIASPVVTYDGHTLPWVNHIRYLGTLIVQNRQFKGDFSYAKQSFYRASNAIFGKVGRLASEEVVIELFVSKCIPVLLYGVECFPLNKRDMNSLDFPVIRFLMKLFRSSNIDLINECRQYFNLYLPHELIEKRQAKFFQQYAACEELQRHFGLRVV